jgi:hypothetical protein
MHVLQQVLVQSTYQALFDGVRSRLTAACKNSLHFLRARKVQTKLLPSSMPKTHRR